MKNIITTISPDMKIISFTNTKDISQPKQEEITDTIIDSFNKQIFLGDQFKQKIEKIIKEMNFVYPNDGEKIQKTLDLFLESSHKLLGDYLQKTLDLYTAFKPEFPEIENKTNDATKNVNYVYNNQWMEDWIEQNNSHNADFETIPLFDGNLDEFNHFSPDDDMN
jgi:hypothetical protein